MAVEVKFFLSTKIFLETNERQKTHKMLKNFL